jgi:NADP-dependent 3-hydroxy acid dehydrogenase YdfG
MTQGIENKVVVITGASSGLGEAASRRLARDGAKLVLGARRVERLEALARELSLPEGSVLKTDVTDPVQVKALIDQAVKLHGRVDVLINNAGLMPHSPLERAKITEWNQMIDVNIKGVLYGIAAALPHMQAQKSGHIINVSSVAGHKVGKNNAVYSATKHAVRVISEGISAFYEEYAISPDSFGSIVAFAMSQPDDVDINEVLYRPTRQEI